MKKIILLITYLVLPFYVFSISTDTIYINRIGAEVSKDSARFFRIVTQVDSNNYKIEDHFLTGQIQMVAYNSSPKEVVRKGKYIFYDSLGFVSSEGAFHLGNKIGEWKSYYLGTKNIKSIRTFNDNNKGYYLKVFDSINSHLILEGRYNEQLNREGIFKTYFAKNDSLLESINYINGIKQGIAYEYYNTGVLKRKELFENGKLKKGELFDKNGEKQKYYPYREKAKLDRNLYEYLVNNVSVYKKSKQIGKLKIKYTITKFGNIIDVVILENSNPEANNEIIDAILNLKKCIPAKIENQPIDSTIINTFGISSTDED